MWFAGGLAALSSVTYPSISAFVSVNAREDQQGKIDHFVFPIIFFFRSRSGYGKWCTWFM
jgi:hypothetical protein